MPAFSGGYAAGGAAIAVKKNILGQEQAESSLCLYAAGTGALLFGVSHRPRGRLVSFSVFSCLYTGAAAVLLFGVLCLPCGQCRCAAAVVPFSVFCARMWAKTVKVRNAVVRRAETVFFVVYCLCLFGFLLICSNFKKSPNSAVSFGSNRIHFPSRYVCALS